MGSPDAYSGYKRIVIESGGLSPWEVIGNTKGIMYFVLVDGFNVTSALESLCQSKEYRYRNIGDKVAAVIGFASVFTTRGCEPVWSLFVRDESTPLVNTLHDLIAVTAPRLSLSMDEQLNVLIAKGLTTRDEALRGLREQHDNDKYSDLRR